MAMHIPKAPGFMSMLKDGAMHFGGIEEAVFRNIEACIGIAKTTRSTFGPAGQNKIVINHIGKQFVTNDAATILRELEVAHPAAKMLVMATQQQEQEAGDGTNMVFQLAGSLLEQARDLIKMGLSVTQIIEGYEQASKKSLTLLDGNVKDLRDAASVKKLIRTSIMSKQIDLEDFLADLVTNACISVLPDKSHFNVDAIRILKILGSGVTKSKAIKGMVFRRDVEGDVKNAKNSKVVIYSCPLDSLQTETKGTVLLSTAAELTEFSKGEEVLIEATMTRLKAAGVAVVVSGGKIGELALHYANKLGLMVVRLTSKFDLRRLAKATGSTVLPQFTVPTTEEMGHIDSVTTDEIADANIVIFEQGKSECAIVTIVLRGSTENIMDDVERAIDDGVNTFKCLTRCTRMVAGAGAVEVELARLLLIHADTVCGLEQYAIREYARAFEITVKALAENSGQKATEVIAQLYAAHEAGDKNAGLVYASGKDPVVQDAVKANVIDLHTVKHWAIRFATGAACIVLRVDEIIMARPAGGPKPRDPRAMDED